MNKTNLGTSDLKKSHQFFHLFPGHFWDNTSISSDPWSLGPTYLTLFAEASGKSYLGKEQEKNGDVYFPEIFHRFLERIEREEGSERWCQSDPSWVRSLSQ